MVCFAHMSSNIRYVDGGDVSLASFSSPIGDIVTGLSLRSSAVLYRTVDGED
jgi:hypothetical protein